ncbi:hypothetical protein HHK36_021902 [Tetracentron sinense]|uniref:FLZ-type domain-containing protein n=1 Tax=Tetracentron sinense TaxID=13715 RepID=A0A834YW31_TETSI|nr:hypothetical protein HHK36_021902 [Tetracentron sinense]
MLGKRSRPAIGKLPDPLVPGDRSRFPDMITTSPLEFKIISPRGLKNIALGGVGLGIVAALEKSGGSRAEIPAKFIVGSLNLKRPDQSARTSTKFRGGLEGSQMGCWENYTYMTSHTPDQSFTRVYCDHEDGGFDRRCRGSSGEKAFCSSECRYRQIVSDERKEKCGSKASRSADISSSTYSRGRLFSTGIIAA